ncbi:MAG TPA: hypothetical protein VGG02_14500 [Chthoniobacterales bacterium]|jgi:hypothetical protein
MPTTITNRIATLFKNASEVCRAAETSLSQRVVYITRAAAMRGVLTSALEAMNELERLAVPADFDDEWRALRVKVAFLITKSQRIIAGSDCAPAPCRSGFRY